MRRPAPARALPAVPGWPRARIDARLPSPASRADAEKARFWTDLEAPLDPSRLPAVIQTDRPGVARRAGRRVLIGALALLVLSGAAHALLWADAPWEEIVLGVAGLPTLLALLGAAVLWAVRGQPDALRLELNEHRVRFGQPPTQWEEALSAYAGLALRRHLMRDPTRNLSRHYSAGERAAGMHRRVERWWIELVHENPARTVVLWASDEPMDDGLERVDTLAAALRLPILTTSNRYWVEDTDDADDAEDTDDARMATAHPAAGTSARHSLATGGANWIPRLLGLFVMLPLAAGTGWLAWTVSQETQAMLQTWQPVQVTVLDKSGSATMRLAIVDAGGQRREADVTRTTDLKAYAEGESFDAYADPAQPDVLRPAGAASLWGGVGMLAFFATAFGGAALFLLRTRIAPR